MSRLSLQGGLSWLLVWWVAFTAGAAIPSLPWIPSHTDNPITLRTYTRVCLAPCKLDLTVVVPPHVDNRRLDVAWGSVDNPTGGSFSRALDGDKADSVFTRTLVLGSGEWVIVGALTRVTGGKVVQHATEVNVEVR